MNAFKTYEDITFFIGRNITLDDSEPEMSSILATSASFSIDHNLSEKRFVDDHKIKLVLDQDKDFVEGREYDFLMGETENFAKPIPESLKIIEDGSRINFNARESMKTMYVVGDHYPGEYWIKLKPDSNFTLTKADALEGKIQELPKKYVSNSVPSGQISISFYIDTSNYDDIFNPYGIFDLSQPSMIDETGVKAQLGEFIFNNIYITRMSFNIRPFAPIEATADFVFFGEIERGEEHEGSIVDEDETLPHGIKSKVSGTSELGLQHPIEFSYSFSISRVPKFECPVGKAEDSTDGEFPVRVHKGAIEIETSIKGEDLNPYLDINGKDAIITAELYDMTFLKNYIATFTNLATGRVEKLEFETKTEADALAELAIVCPTASNPTFVEYKDQSKGLLKTFKCDGKIKSQKIDVTAGGMMSGSISVQQIFR